MATRAALAITPSNSVLRMVELTCKMTFVEAKLLSAIVSLPQILTGISTLKMYVMIHMNSSSPVLMQ